MTVEAAAYRACAVLPAEPGVYRFRDSRGRVMYVGRASNLRARTRSYWGDLTGRRHLRRMVPQIVSVEALVCASVHEAGWLERNLLERSLPRWNRARGGQEIPAWLELRGQPRRAGLDLLRAASDTAAGPYLGTERARAARNGLLRAWPLHLTGDRMNSVDRDLAEVRGVGPEQLGSHVTMIGQVLRRDDDALRQCLGLLEAARDRAAANLGFEIAQRIHEEMAAVRWVASPQRVTGALPEGLVVVGRAEGITVRLTAGKGRLDRWSVESSAGSEHLPDHTPKQWQEFARTNALLAAALNAAHRR